MRPSLGPPSSDDSAIRNVLPILWITACYHIMKPMGQIAYFSSSSLGGGTVGEVAVYSLCWGKVQVDEAHLPSYGDGRIRHGLDVYNHRRRRRTTWPSCRRWRQEKPVRVAAVFVVVVGIDGYQSEQIHRTCRYRVTNHRNILLCLYKSTSSPL